MPFPATSQERLLHFFGMESIDLPTTSFYTKLPEKGEHFQKCFHPSASACVINSLPAGNSDSKELLVNERIVEWLKVVAQVERRRRSKDKQPQQQQQPQQADKTTEKQQEPG